MVLRLVRGLVAGRLVQHQVARQRQYRPRLAIDAQRTDRRRLHRHAPVGRGHAIQLDQAVVHQLAAGLAPAEALLLQESIQFHSAHSSMSPRAGLPAALPARPPAAPS
ncbi:hypothetical protein D3C72_1992650 [compost metagenome]